MGWAQLERNAVRLPSRKVRAALRTGLSFSILKSCELCPEQLISLEHLISDRAEPAVSQRRKSGLTHRWPEFRNWSKATLTGTPKPLMCQWYSGRLPPSHGTRTRSRTASAVDDRCTSVDGEPVTVWTDHRRTSRPDCVNGSEPLVEHRPESSWPRVVNAADLCRQAVPRAEPMEECDRNGSAGLCSNRLLPVPRGHRLFPRSAEKPGQQFEGCPAKNRQDGPRELDEVVLDSSRT
jgi:hypothetical protein